MSSAMMEVVMPQALRGQTSMAGVLALFDPAAVRSRSQLLLARARSGDSSYFHVHDARMPGCIQSVLEVTRANYPDLNVPFHSRWRHFNAGGHDRAGHLLHQVADPLERARCAFDLVITSVLLDAGAGAQWQYREAAGQQTLVYNRSEGLAVGSLRAFEQGVFSSHVGEPWRADAAALQQLSLQQLSVAFQVSASNPLSGLDARVELLRRLGTTVAAQTQYFGQAGASSSEGRLGYLVDYFFSLAQNKQIPAKVILATLLWALRDAWPLRFSLSGIALGDCWRHPALHSDDATAGLMPFHKLSQWLTYSLVEPLEQAGLSVTGVHELTGLPEYRNGGLLLDSKVLTVKDSQMLAQRYKPSDTFIVEWRALTVALLDEIGLGVGQVLGRTPEQFPLARTLEGGTWHTGRKLAREARVGGGPPLDIELDATVF
jgi:Protein of unknown function (DUF1688)